MRATISTYYSNNGNSQSPGQLLWSSSIWEEWRAAGFSPLTGTSRHVSSLESDLAPLRQSGHSLNGLFLFSTAASNFGQTMSPSTQQPMNDIAVQMTSSQSPTTVRLPLKFHAKTPATSDESRREGDFETQQTEGGVAMQ